MPCLLLQLTFQSKDMYNLQGQDTIPKGWLQGFSTTLKTLKRKLNLNISVIKPTRWTNFADLFCHETLHISDSSSVHHQEFIHCTLSNGVCHTGPKHVEFHDKINL